MTTEDKALVLLNEVSLYKCENVDTAPHKDLCTALRRAIEQHEAFRQKVSDALRDYYGGGYVPANSRFAEFILPTPKPDPLVAAMKKAGWGDAYINNSEPSLRAALDALGFEIREKSK